MMNIYSSFPQETDNKPASLIDCHPLNKKGIFTEIPPLTLPEVQIILNQVKSGSPRDVTPPTILNAVTNSVSPVIREVINASFESGLVPPLWKQAMVKALLKKPNLDPEDGGNYRPISLLPGISKIAEKHLNSALSIFLESNDYLHPSQMDYRPLQGTETVLLAVLEEARKILDDGGCAAILLLDLSAAFDTVNHRLLISRLREVGLGGTALKWLCSFLKDRTFEVYENGITLECMPLKCGVPQGSSLSPTLFNIYMRSLANEVLPFGILIATYADDTQLVVSFNQLEKTYPRLSMCLERVAGWMESSYLKINGAKTELMFLGNTVPSQIGPFWPNCLGPPPLPKDQIKSLRVYLEPCLDFKGQAQKEAAGCFGIIRMLRKILSLLPASARKLAVQALILSRIDYANALYLGAPCGTIKRLQIVQNCAARLLTQTPARQSAKPALATLHWLPVLQRIQFRALCMAHKAVSGKGSSFIRSLVTPYRPTGALRSDSKHLVSVPKIRRARSGGRSFVYNVAKLWNDLPLDIRQEANYLTFRKLIKTHLFP